MVPLLAQHHSSNHKDLRWEAGLEARRELQSPATKFALRSGVSQIQGSGVNLQGPGGGGCLLEQTWGGSRTIKLEGGDTRKYLEDGDTVTLSGFCQGDGFRVGFGECKGKILPAKQ